VGTVTWQPHASCPSGPRQLYEAQRAGLGAWLESERVEAAFDALLVARWNREVGRLPSTQPMEFGRFVDWVREAWRLIGVLPQEVPPAGWLSAAQLIVAGMELSLERADGY
jgi:hypothetical protein